MMPNLNRTHSNSSSDLEALLKNDGGNKAAGPHHKEFVSLKRRAKLRQQEKHGRIRLGILILAVFFVIFLSFVSNGRNYQPITVIVPQDFKGK